MKALSRMGANSTATCLMELPLPRGAVYGLKVWCPRTGLTSYMSSDFLEKRLLNIDFSD
jgi:hypothetical protein